MKKDYTHIALIIDRSGSMSSNWSDVVGGYESIIKEQQEQDGKCTLTVAAFDDSYDLLEDFSNVQKVSDKLEIRPRGMTALLDAIGKTVSSVGEKLAKMKERDRPEKVIVMVQTDGYENASKEYTKEKIKEMIETQTNVYNWEFMFLGASLDAVNEARNWGFDTSKSAVYSTQNTADTYQLFNTKMSMMRSVDKSDVAAYYKASTFSDEEVEKINK